MTSMIGSCCIVILVGVSGAGIGFRGDSDATRLDARELSAVRGGVADGIHLWQRCKVTGGNCDSVNGQSNCAAQPNGNACTTCVEVIAQKTCLGFYLTACYQWSSGCGPQLTGICQNGNCVPGPGYTGSCTVQIQECSQN